MSSLAQRDAGATPHIPRWGMVVDLNACVGCQTCTVACKHANATQPDVQWRRVLDVEYGAYPDVQRLFLPVGCQHCDEPPCVPVCPTGATYRRPDGIVAIDYDLCIGCGYCAVACPYNARTITHAPRAYYGDGLETVQETAVLDERRLGVAQKCTFCAGRVDAGLKAGLTPGVDPQATPACASACIANALHFGDFADPGSNVSRLLATSPSFGMHEELGTKPSLRYLYETPIIAGRAPFNHDEYDDESLADPSNPLVGPLQGRWDLRAALNFTLGGMGSGLAIGATLLAFAGALPPAALPICYAVAAVLVGAGLFSVFLEIGRKLRFLYALRRPQSSWMTREVYVVAVLFPLMAAALFWRTWWLDGGVALAAAAFLYCQARILFAAKGIPAWRHPLMPWMLVTTGLLEGLALAVIVTTGLGQAMATTLPAALGIALALGMTGLWIAYRQGARRNGVPPLAQRALAGVTPTLHAVGHALPLAGFATALAAPSLAAGALVVAAVAAVTGGALWKIAVITRAAYFQGFSLPKLPRRGSGTRASFHAPAAGGLQVGREGERAVSC